MDIPIYKKIGMAGGIVVVTRARSDIKIYDLSIPNSYMESSFDLIVIKHPMTANTARTAMYFIASW